MNPEEREEKMMSEFNEITGGTVENSRFFLESSNWNLELALASFYEEFGGLDGAAQFNPLPGGDDRVNPITDTTEAIIIESDPDEPGEGDRVLGVSTVVPSSTTSARTTNRSRMGTLSAMRNESSSDEDEGQTYYAGGSEHSGQQVVGPSRPSHELITDMFRSLRDQGGVESISHEPGGVISFSGHGYRLGQSANDPNVLSSASDQASNVPSQQREVVLRLWRDGFSINDGHLRSYSDPQEKEFLARIRQGNVPADLFPNEGTIHLSLEDHRNENFVPQILKPVAFSGKGHVLGSTSSESNKDDEKVEAETPVQPEQAPSVRTSSISIDQNQPTSTIQIRLPNGERIPILLNHTHTIGNLRLAITEQRPQFQGGNFTLLTIFPRTELSDDNMTIEKADILNSCIILKD